MTASPLIFVDDDPDLRRATTQMLMLAGFDVQAFDSAEAALPSVTDTFEGPIVTDIRMPRMNGLRFFERIRAIDPDLPVILVTGHGDVDLAVAALKDGVYDFISKPFESARLSGTVARAAEKRRLVLENRRLIAAAAQPPADLPLIGETAGVRRLREMARQVADADVDALILGETGTGKEVVANLLHHWSRRRARNFVALNCGALPESVLESELFGHEPGAFTGAIKRRVGRIEHASGGTLFLDEIDRIDAARVAGEAVARARDARGRTARHQRTAAARPARRRGDQGRPRRRRSARQLPGRPLLSPERRHAAHPAASRAAG